MKRWGLFLFHASLMCLLQSHEFWLEPVKFKVKAGEELVVNFLVGNNFTGQAWDLSKNKVERMQLFEKGPTQDLLTKVPAMKGGKLKAIMPNPGTKILALKSSLTFTEVSAEDFNQYLRTEGLDEIYDWRVKNGKENSSAKELYTRYSKLLIQVDDVLDDTWKRPVGHRLEIFPDQNPGNLKSGDYVGCKIMFDGRPVPHTQVRVWGHVGNKIFLQNIYTEDDGTFRFPISAKGPWMISTIKMEKSKRPEADWESSWASLVFNVE